MELVASDGDGKTVAFIGAEESMSFRRNVACWPTKSSPGTAEIWSASFRLPVIERTQAIGYYAKAETWSDGSRTC
jgi:hypothetical protein